jgi:hypothetical protein
MLPKEDAAKLLGVDVGFSAKRATTAIALLDGNQLHVGRAGTKWESRAAAAFAAQGTATMVGEGTGGWFWLPPWVFRPCAMKAGLQRVRLPIR